MNIDDVDFSYVLESAVRTCIDAADPSVNAVIYDRARNWMAANGTMIGVWLEPPAVNDVKSLVFRRLLAHLHDSDIYDDAGKHTLGHVIAAGKTWDEVPTREVFYPDDSWEVSDVYGIDLLTPLEVVTRWRTMAKIQRMQHRSNGGVYLAHSEAFGLYKIGKAKNSLTRVSAQRTSCPDINLVASVPYGGLMLETFLHRTFQHCRESGEWFDLGENAKGDFLDAIVDWENAQ